MARVDVGNDLSGYVIKPGWKISDDGYGLRTATIQFTTDVTNGVDFIRGEACPISGYEYLHLHKQTSTMDGLGIQIQTCDYVGIAPDVNEGNNTNPQITSTNSLTTENITANPNFFTAAGGGYGDVIAGAGPYAQDDKAPMVTSTDATGKAVKVHGYLGQNGACFERDNGGRFIGFVDPSVPALYGKTNYLSPVNAISGHYYTKQDSEVNAVLNYLGWTSNDSSWNDSFQPLLPDWFGMTLDGTNGNCLLLSQVNVEDFGDLYKINYEIRYSVVGWSDMVYPSAT